MKKRWLTLGTALAVSAMMMTGCGTKDSADQAANTTQESESETAGETAENNTEEAGETDTKETDDTAKASFEGLISPVSREDGSGTKYAIGYVSPGSLNDSVKALNIDGAEAAVDNIKSGTYKISRPFNIITKEGLSDVAADFVKYIMSEDGQAVDEENGYISQGNEGVYGASEGISATAIALDWACFC